MSFQKLIKLTSSSNCFLKFKRLDHLNNKRNLSSTLIDQTSSQDKLCSLDGNWHISCGLVIQRFPLLVPDFNIVEKNIYDYKLKLEYEKSLISDYDYAIHKVRNEKSKEEKYLQIVSNYDKYLKEGELFKVAGKKTEDDLKNELKSFNRCLDSSLFLVINQLDVGKPKWTFPISVLNKDDESLRMACERLLERIGDKSKFRILGNSPFAYVKYKYPINIRNRLNKRGNKIFYFKCELIDLKHQLAISDQNLADDYKWLTIDDCYNEINHEVWYQIWSGLIVEKLDEKILEIVNRKLNEKKIELSNC